MPMWMPVCPSRLICKHVDDVQLNEKGLKSQQCQSESQQFQSENSTCFLEIDVEGQNGVRWPAPKQQVGLQVFLGSTQCTLAPVKRVQVGEIVTGDRELKLLWEGKI